MPDRNPPALSWTSRFTQTPLRDGSLLLSGEIDSYILGKETHARLLPVIEGRKSVNEAIEQEKSISGQAYLLYTLSELSAKGVINETGANNKKYFLPDFNLPPVVSGLGDTELINLSGKDFTLPLFSPLLSSSPLTIVITDDYLDPRLEKINRTCRIKGKNWLLLKLTGERPLAGPFYSPAVKEAPCHECLAERLFRNQSVRRWKSGGNRKNVAPLPQWDAGEDLHRTIAQIEKQVHVLVKKNRTGLLWTVNTADFTMQRHLIMKNPQCHVCGGELGTSSFASQPRVFKKTLKLSSSDGGSRAVPPEQTVKNILPQVSPVTGIIREFTPLPGKETRNLTTYRTIFPRTPLGKSCPGNGDFLQISLGKGISEAQAMASALGEAVERIAVQYRGDEPLRRGKPADLDKPALRPDRLTYFSPGQFSGRKASLYPPPGIHAYHPSQAIHWTTGWSLTTREVCYLPFAYCYANSPYDYESQSVFSSNGCAAGNNLEEAVLQGFLELIERDATAVWWYNRIPRPEVDLTILPGDSLAAIRDTLGEKWEFWVLDLTHDFMIPVMAAIGRSRENDEIRLGFGCHPDAALACNRSLTELCQLIAIKNGKKDGERFDFRKIKPEAFLFPREPATTVDGGYNAKSSSRDIAEEIDFCLKRAEELMFQVVLHDSSRGDLPLRTVKMIVPGLCHIWPEYGNPRLYEVPVSMGWLAKKKTEHELNPLALFV